MSHYLKIQIKGKNKFSMLKKTMKKREYKIRLKQQRLDKKFKPITRFIAKMMNKDKQILTRNKNKKK